MPTFCTYDMYVLLIEENRILILLNVVLIVKTLFRSSCYLGVRDLELSCDLGALPRNLNKFPLGSLQTADDTLFCLCCTIY